MSSETSSDMHPILRDWSNAMEQLQWSAFGLDARLRLTWISSELREFQDADDTQLGIGLHLLDAFTLRWWQTLEQDLASLDFFGKLLGYSRFDLDSRGVDAHSEIEGPFADIVPTVDPLPIPNVDFGSFDYKDPRLSQETPSLTVNFCFLALKEDDGTLIGSVVIFFIGVRPNILSLLGRGNQEMYERMARLVQPSQHRAAILFCDLAESGRLSRELSNAAYFGLVRRLWTQIDKVIADHKGITGKHAGDGATAFFLVTDVGSTEAAAAASVRAARDIHRVSEEIFKDVLDSPCRMKVGVHWAGSLYMGQLVPGGRLEVTALGDEVNETARIEATAEPGRSLVSKDLLQQLGPEAAADLGLDVEKVRFTPLAEMPGADDKAVRDAGAVPVTTLE